MCATVEGQCLEYLVYITLVGGEMFDFNLKRQIEMQPHEGNFDWFERQKYSSRSNLISNNQCKWLPSLS